MREADVGQPVVEVIYGYRNWAREVYFFGEPGAEEVKQLAGEPFNASQVGLPEMFSYLVDPSSYDPELDHSTHVIEEVSIHESLPEGVEPDQLSDRTFDEFVREFQTQAAIGWRTFPPYSRLPAPRDLLYAIIEDDADYLCDAIVQGRDFIDHRFYLGADQDGECALPIEVASDHAATACARLMIEHGARLEGLVGLEHGDAGVRDLIGSARNESALLSLSPAPKPSAGRPEL